MASTDRSQANLLKNVINRTFATFYKNNINNRTGRAGTNLSSSDTLDITLGDYLPDCCTNPPGTYIITYFGNSNTGGSPPVDGQSPYAADSSVTILGPNNLERLGYVFAGWNTLENGSGDNFTEGSTFMINSNIYLYAQWTLIPAIRYTVIYYGNTNTGGNPSNDNLSPYASGSSVIVLTENTLVKTGYNFGGWNTLANGLGVNYLAGQVFSISSDTSLYAQWVPFGSYTVTYYGNTNTGGIALIDSLSPYIGGSTVTVLGQGSLVKSGYGFSGWNTSVNGLSVPFQPAVGISYIPGTTFIINANTALYAQWTPITYTVTYNGNTNTGGSPLTDSSSPYITGSIVTVLGQGTLVKANNNFAGWNTQANGLGISYAIGATFSIITDTILYAKWNPITYTVTYNGNTNTSGTPLTDSSSPYVTGSTVTVLGQGTLIKTNNNFTGWNTQANGSGTTYAISSTFTITTNTTLFAQWSAITYTVTYNGNTNTGGTPLTDSSSPYITGSIVTVLGQGSLVKTNNNFTGWNTQADGSGTSLSVSATFPIITNTTLFAQWAPITYSVTYNGNTNTGGSPLTDSSSPYVTGSTVTVLGQGTLVKTNNNFTGWNTQANGSGTSYAIGATFPITINTTLYAQWAPITYTVTYNGNANTGGNPLTDGSSPYITGSTVTVLGKGTLVKTGETFAGWNTAANGSGINYAIGATFSINANTTLYAQWTSITYTVTYNGNTNTGGNPLTDDSSPYATGYTVTVLGQGTLVKTNNNFTGWNTQANGSGISYAIASTFTITTNTTLYAQWAPITYTVAYNGNTNTGGSPLTDSSSPYLTGSTVTVLGQGTLVKTNNNFTGWNTNADGSGSIYASGNTFTITTNTILYAQWTPVTYTVTYNGNTNTGGSELTDGSSPYTIGSTVTVLGQGTLVKTNNNFTGWNTSANGSGASYAIGGTFTISTNTTLYAQWSPIIYTVAYNGNTNTGGSPLTDGSSPYLTGSTVTVLGQGTLVKTNNNFTGWNTLANGSGTSYAIGATFTIGTNTTLYAQWTPITCLVTYNGNTNTSGSPLTDSSSPYVIGSTVTVLGQGTLVKTNNNFTGWNTQANGSGTSYAIGATFSIATNTILYAQWTPITYTVAYDGNTNTGGSPLTDGSSPYVTGSTVTVLGQGTLVKTNNNFTGWNTEANGSGTTYAIGATFTISANTTLYAQWAPITYTVAYNGNTNTGGSPLTDASSPYVTGSTVTVLGEGTLVKSGNTFAGWNTAANGSGTSYATGATFPISSNTILYAQWTPAAGGSYTVTYNGNTNTGGNPVIDSSSPYTSGSTVTVLGNIVSPRLAKTGFGFAGWNTAADGSGISYIGGNTFTISADTTFYAQWIIGVSLLYNAGTGGSGLEPLSSRTTYVQYSIAGVVDNRAFVNGALVFGGWNTAANGSGTSYAAGSTISMTGTIILYAQWINPSIQYSLVYNAGTNGSGTPPAGSTIYNSNTPVTVLGNTGPFTNSGGLTFYGWNTLADGTGTSYSAGTIFNITANMTLYAHWVDLSSPLTVTYDGNGNTGGAVPANPTNYPSGVRVPILGQNTLTKPGYTFVGWNTTSNGEGSAYVPGYTFSSQAVTLYAHWIPGSPVKNCGGGSTSGGSGATSITYIFPFSQIFKSTDAVTFYTTVLLGTTTANYGFGSAPLGIISIASKTVITSSLITINAYTTYSNSGNNYNYSKNITNVTDVTYWPVGTSISSVTFGTTALSNSNNPPNYNISIQNSVNGCGLSSNAITSGAIQTVYNFFNQGCILNFSDGSNTNIANSPNSVFYTSNSGTTWTNIPRTSYPYALIVPNADNCVTSIVITPSAGSSYTYPPLPDYTIDYYGNGNTSGTPPTSQYMDPYISGTTSVTLRTNSGGLAKTGFTFSGWNSAIDGTGTNYAINTTYNTAASLRLYAKWI
jgi:uncharacterized repeat protein (TIGR02543 family)